MEHPVLGRRRIVFLVDPDESSRVTHETILRAEGYELLVGADGGQALRQIRDQAPDLLLIGPSVGRMLVTQLVRTVKQEAGLEALRVCAYGPSEGAAELKAAGADAVLATPVPAAELVRAVAGLIGRA